MTYWLDLFTGTTWKEFIDAGGRVSGFSPRRRNIVSKIKPGDILLCYLTGVQLWVGALEVEGPSQDKSDIWKDAEFPARLAVKPIIVLQPEYGVPMDELFGKVDFFLNASHKGKYKGFVRGSPNRFKKESDGTVILDLLRNAKTSPISRSVDAKKLARKPVFSVKSKRGKREITVNVTVPEPEEFSVPTKHGKSGDDQIGPTTSRHTEIQHRLLILGSEMGLDVWVANNDRMRTWQGQTLGSLPNVIFELPTQFNDATQRTIELIDVLWLKGNSIVAAFEVECTTSVYSGLLRMSDLLALQPNLDMKLYIVAPDERRAKVAQEIARPTFSLSEKPLTEVCGFIAFNKLCEVIDGIKKLNLASSVQPSFLNSFAEYFT